MYHISQAVRQWRRRVPSIICLLAPLSIFVGAGSAIAAMDLRNASVERLDNGLTVILLEDRNFPVTSVQMLYRVGARDETAGQTGLAHFLEHMAFRDSENFPDTGLVSSIYASGGEWHGYTWTDQTTYFATVPKEHLDLLLRIEADRMTRLIISPDDMEAERGAVLAELHMYENYPTSMLIDAVMFASFVAHPYRNNTIGWESDIVNLAHDDVVGFYRRHYHPANAVLAVVGDFDSNPVRARIAELFGEFPGRPPTALPHTVEPLQKGERRVRLGGNSDDRQFLIAYRAPSANSADFAAFLVLQELLGASGGVNFRQNDWGVPVAHGAVLDGAAENLTTWYPPSAQDYVFTIGGTAPAGAAQADVEQEIEKRIAATRQRPPDKKALAGAIDDVLDQLVFDVETTEDAAHQLAFFEGLHALATLLELPDRVAAVSAADVQRVSRNYLPPARRTIGWFEPAAAGGEPHIGSETAFKAPAESIWPKHAIDKGSLPPPVTATLGGGIPVIVQQSDLSPAAYLQIVLPANKIAITNAAAGSPVHGYSSLSFRTRPKELSETIVLAHAAIADAGIDSAKRDVPSADPETRLEQVFAKFMASDDAPRIKPTIPALIVLSGDVDANEALALLEESFGKLGAQSHPARQSGKFKPAQLTVRLGVPLAQAQLGYIVPAPGPREPAADAYRLLQYILSHDYEGRLGTEAISRRGLAYYIDSRYRSDGDNGWITLAVGVDPEKTDTLMNLVSDELRRLADEPPTEAEVEEAKAYLVGRAKSGAQSNEELAVELAVQWLWYGELQSAGALAGRLARISHQDVLEVVRAFTNGKTIVVQE